MSTEKLDALTEQRISAVTLRHYARGLERCGIDEGDTAAVNALRSRIRQLIEQARLSAQHDTEASEARRNNPPDTRLCDECDGCGWNEGGSTLKTGCGKCSGTGVLPWPHKVPPHMPGRSR